MAVAMSVFDYRQAMAGGVANDQNGPGPLWRYMAALGMKDEESPEDVGLKRYGTDAGDFL